jgi:anti-sigma factor RsiW
MREPARFEEWDAAYVLGSLSSDDRHAYEEHLSGCEACRAAVTELAALPGLLSAVTPDAVPALLEEHRPDGDPEDPPERLPGLQHLAHRVRRRRRTRWAAAGVTASALLASLLLPSAEGLTAFTAQLAPVAGSPLSAEARLTAEPWGSRIAVDCHYPTGSGRTAEYALYMTDRRGKATLLSTWNERPGSSVQVVATTATPVHDVVRIDVRKAASGDVVLAAPVAAAE